MFESIIVRVALIIYGILALLAVLLIWKNSAAPDALKNTGIVVASILPVLIAVLPYLISEKLSDEFHYILFYDAVEKEITAGEFPNTYASTYVLMFSNLSVVPEASKAESLDDFMDNKGLDIVEKGILETLIVNFMSHWDIVLSESIGPTYETKMIKKGSEGELKKITIKELKDKFHHNKLISTPGVLIHSDFSLPPGSTIAPIIKDKSRFIMIKNGFGVINIEIYRSLASVAQQGIWGVFKPDPKNLNRFYTIEYLVKLTMKVGRFKRYSPAMNDYKKWFANIRMVLSEYDWQNIEKKIERSEIRKAISKSLEM